MITTALMLLALQAPPCDTTRSLDTAPLHTLLAGAVTSGSVGSAAGLVSWCGRVVFLEAAGESGPGVAMPTDAIVRLASITKPVTATAIMMLVQDGKLRLDDRVDHWFPGFGAQVATAEGPRAAREPVRIVDLLTHMAGVADEGPRYDSLWELPTARAFAAGLGAIPLLFESGTQFHYGNMGSAYEVLGALVEITSGQSFRDFAAARIFEPLGMRDTYFQVPDEKLGRLAAQYRRMPDGRLTAFRARGEEQPTGQFFSGGGGLRSTLADYCRLATFLMQGGELDGRRLLPESAVRQMLTDQTGGRYPRAGYGWGFGVEVQPNGAFGWNGGTGTMFVADPARRMVAIIFVPTTPGNPAVSPLRRAFIDGAYQLTGGR